MRRWLSCCQRFAYQLASPSATRSMAEIGLAGCYVQVKTPVEVGLSRQRWRPLHALHEHASQTWRAGRPRGRDDATAPVAPKAVIGLGGDSEPRSQLGHGDDACVRAGV